MEEKEIETPKEEIPQEINPLQVELDELKDKYLRMAAESENIKRRARLDALAASREKMLDLAENILPVVDAARAALKHSPEDEGLKMILSSALSALEKSGIKPIKAVGEKLNPNIHQAISTAKSDAAAGTITEEVQTGFELDGQPLRPSLVIVAG
ncbi:MAG: nucleotide exchange factor GrpE [Rickettsiales bacterium]|jgi:molecular chaperone GrpE|nr:nucleotide exchange factor GrpE [Rickettsiales bacterium]